MNAPSPKPDRGHARRLLVMIVIASAAAAVTAGAVLKEHGAQAAGDSHQRPAPLSESAPASIDERPDAVAPSIDRLLPAAADALKGTPGGARRNDPIVLRVVLHAVASQRGGPAFWGRGPRLLARTMFVMNAVPEPLAAPAAGAADAAPAPRSSAPSDALFSTLYSELHRLARREAARAGPAAVVSPTTLLHEAYLDMSQRDSLAFPDRGSFLAYAARAMRAVAIDRARADGAQKRGGGLDITSLDTETAENVADPGMLSEIGAALDELAEVAPELANVVDLKFFCGFGVAEIAAMHGVSERTVQRQWEKARLLLFRALAESS